MQRGSKRARESEDENSKKIQTRLEQILHNQKLLLQKQETNASEHRKDISSLKELVKKADSNSIDAAFLTETLKETTVELKGVRKTMRAQAGKIGAATAKANKALKENARLSAERKTTVEHQEVIDTIWQAVSQANDDARRAEDRIASVLNIKDHPRGDPSDNFPYNQYPDPLLKDYHKALTEAYKEAPSFNLRKNMPPLQDFPEAAKSRYFHLCVSLLLSTPLRFRDLDKSPSQHMRELVGLSGPIFHEDVYKALKNSFVIEEKFFCKLLSRQYVEDTTIDPMIQGDPFTIPEVRHVVLQPCFYPSNALFKTDEALETGSAKGCELQLLQKGYFRRRVSRNPQVLHVRVVAILHYASSDWNCHTAHARRAHPAPRPHRKWTVLLESVCKRYGGAPPGPHCQAAEGGGGAG